MIAHCPIPARLRPSRSTPMRAIPGAISFRSSGHLPLKLYSNWVKPVALPPGRARLCNSAGADRIDRLRKNDRHGVVHQSHCLNCRDCGGEDQVGSKRDQFSRKSTTELVIASSPARIELYVAANCPAKLLHLTQECCQITLSFGVFGSRVHQHADAPNAPALLRPRHHRPSHSTANQREELPPLHSITSSVRPSNIAGTSSPIALAALRLITNSNLVGCSTANSAGFAPLRILSTYTARRWNEALRLGP